MGEGAFKLIRSQSFLFNLVFIWQPCDVQLWKLSSIFKEQIIYLCLPEKSFLVSGIIIFFILNKKFPAIYLRHEGFTLLPDDPRGTATLEGRIA